MEMKEKKHPTPGRDEPIVPGPGPADFAAGGEVTGDADRPDGETPAAREESQAAAPSPSKESEYLEDLRRITAEFANYRRRVQRERADWEARAKGELLTTILPVLDDLQIARDYWIGRDVGKDAEGMLMILNRLEDLLRASGLEVQDTTPGTLFDPHRHEALVMSPSEEYPEGTILETLRRGYMYRDIMLRPARVRVSQGPVADAS